MAPDFHLAGEIGSKDMTETGPMGGYREPELIEELRAWCERAFRQCGVTSRFLGNMSFSVHVEGDLLAVHVPQWAIK